MGTLRSVNIGFSETEITSIQAKLIKKKMELLDSLRGIKESEQYGLSPDAVGELASRPQHSSNLAPEAAEASVLAKLAKNEIREIEDIEDALVRVEKGQYGMCDNCGDTIPKERLAVYPEARRCYECTVSFEKTQASRLRRPLAERRDFNSKE